MDMKQLLLSMYQQALTCDDQRPFAFTFGHDPDVPRESVSVSLDAGLLGKLDVLAETTGRAREDLMHDCIVMGFIELGMMLGVVTITERERLEQGEQDGSIVVH